MTDEHRSGVGFFRGLTAVVRGTVHALAIVLGLFGRGLAVLTRRSRHHSVEVPAEE